MSSVGETLRAERARKNLPLDQISRETKISARMLEAIEHDRYEQLPGGVFAKSFVRQYARYLGLDEEEIAADLERAIHPEADLPSFATAAPEPAFKVPKVTEWEGVSARRTSSALPSLAVLVAVMLVCSGVYAWWQQKSRQAAAAPPARQVQRVAQTTPPTTASAAPISTAPPSAPAAASPAPDTAGPAARTDESASTQQADQAPSAEAPAAAVNPNATLHVSLTADEPTWVRAWADGKQVLTWTLQPNETKTVDAVDQIRLRTGNAGGLQVTLNGKPVGPLGPKGQIRIVEINSQGFQILLPPKPPAPAPAPESEPAAPAPL